MVVYNEYNRNGGERMIKLNKIRKESGLTQKEVAEHLGMNVNAYQRIEYGTRGTNIENWDKLEDLFQVPQRELRKQEIV